MIELTCRDFSCMSAMIGTISAMENQSPQSMTYKQAGVDINAGDEMVDMIRPMVERTYGPRVMGPYGSFAGMFRLDYNEKLFQAEL